MHGNEMHMQMECWILASKILGLLVWGWEANNYLHSSLQHVYNMIFNRDYFAALLSATAVSSAL